MMISSWKKPWFPWFIQKYPRIVRINLSRGGDLFNKWMNGELIADWDVLEASPKNGIMWSTNLALVFEVEHGTSLA